MGKLLVILLLVISSAFGCLSAAAQEVRPHRLGLDVGIVREADLNELASPLIYRDVFPTAGLSYGFEGLRRRYGASLSYGRPRMTSSIATPTRHVQDGWQFQIGGRYTVRVAQFSSGAGGLFAGAALDNRFKRRHHVYGGRYSEWITEGFSSFGLSGGVRYRSVYLTAEIPLAAYVVRSPYSVKGPFRYRLTSPGAFRGFTARASFERSLNARVALRAAYELDAYRIRNTMPSTTLTHGLVIGFLLRR